VDDDAALIWVHSSLGKNCVVNVMSASTVQPEVRISDRKMDGISEGEPIFKRDCPSPHHAGRNAASNKTENRD
jgi:hypothetical protein